MNIANYFTFFRIFVGPLFLLIYVKYEWLALPLAFLPYVLLFLLAIAELSDAFDGYFARRYNQVTALGKILDPMADSIYRTSVFLTFTLPPVKIPMILIFVFLYRDSIISTLRTVCALKGFVLAARPSGKIKAIIQGIAAISILLLFCSYISGHLTLNAFQNISFWIVSGAAFYTLISGFEYLFANRAHIRYMLNKTSD